MYERTTQKIIYIINFTISDISFFLCFHFYMFDKLLHHFTLLQKPIQYLPEFKNPCWKNGTQLHCLPYFMLIGMDKCGSTDLFDRLIKHPEILGNGKNSTKPSDNKETKWWSWLRYGK